MSARRKWTTWFMVTGLLVLGGCARINETYYLLARDRSTQATNIFRIKVKGFSNAAQTKYSTGFYDREAVERLFSENRVQREYLATQIRQFDDAGKRIQDVSDQLAHAAQEDDKARIGLLEYISASVAGMLGQYRIRLLADSSLVNLYKKDLDTIDGELKMAAQALRDARDPAKAAAQPSHIAEAERGLRSSLASLNAIRLAVDGKNIVHFYDAAGNEIDVANKKMVIFVATDVSRFSEAIRQLAEADEVRTAILATVQGANLQEATVLAKRVEQSDRMEHQRLNRLAELRKTLAQEKDDGKRKMLLLNMASIVADTVFSTEADITNYIHARQQP